MYRKSLYEPITKIWDKGSTPSPDIMSLVRPLFLAAAKGGFSVSLKHIAGVDNPIADALSRFQENRFKELHPDADREPTAIPPHVWP